MKIANDIWFKIGYAILICIIAITAFKVRFEATENTVKTHIEQIIKLNNKTNSIDIELIKLETEIPNIKESIQRIETSQIETQKDIKLLLRKIPDGHFNGN